MRTIAVVSMKGGSGKTTVAAHVAAAAAHQGRRVALLDTDPQQSASRWGDRRDAAVPVVLTVPPSRLAAELQRCADAGTAARVRAVTAAAVLALLTGCAPRGQDADQVAAALTGAGASV